MTPDQTRTASPLRNVLVGGVAAVVLAALMVAMSAAGDIGWKVALALVGLVLWVIGGLSKER